MPPLRKYSTSFGVSMRTGQVSSWSSARTVTSRGKASAAAPSRPVISNVSWLGQDGPDPEQHRALGRPVAAGA
jgi:hypothetical protein